MLSWSIHSIVIFLWALQRLQRSVNFIENMCWLLGTAGTRSQYITTTLSYLKTTANLLPFRLGRPLHRHEANWTGLWVSNIQCLVRDYGHWTCCPQGTGGTWPAHCHQETKERETKTGPRVIGQAPTHVLIKYILKSHKVHFSSLP